MDIRNRIQQLLTAINQGVYEKDTELGLSLLAALAGLPNPWWHAD